MKDCQSEDRNTTFMKSGKMKYQGASSDYTSMHPYIPLKFTSNQIKFKSNQIQIKSNKTNQIKFKFKFKSNQIQIQIQIKSNSNSNQIKFKFKFK